MAFGILYGALIGVLVATVPSPARAEDASPRTASEARRADDEDVWTRHPLALELHLGLGTPVGFIGGELEYSFSPLVAVAVGLGEGLGPYDGSGLHGAGVVRLRPLRGEIGALVFGAAVSTGGFRTPFYSGDSTPVYEGNWATFAQLDVGAELRSKFGTLFRITVGAATLLNPNSVRCYPGADGGPSCGSTTLLTMPTFDLAVGQAF